MTDPFDSIEYPDELPPIPDSAEFDPDMSYFVSDMEGEDSYCVSTGSKILWSSADQVIFRYHNEGGYRVTVSGAKHKDRRVWLDTAFKKEFTEDEFDEACQYLSEVYELLDKQIVWGVGGQLVGIDNGCTSETVHVMELDERIGPDQYSSVNLLDLFEGVITDNLDVFSDVSEELFNRHPENLLAITEDLGPRFEGNGFEGSFDEGVDRVYWYETCFYVEYESGLVSCLPIVNKDSVIRSVASVGSYSYLSTDINPEVFSFVV